jgi:hypothetical protein
MREVGQRTEALRVGFQLVESFTHLVYHVCWLHVTSVQKTGGKEWKKFSIVSQAARKSDGERCKLFHSMRYFFDNYLTYIMVFFLK